MIITKTPFRISFAGGGTDLRAFYQIEPGAVLSTAIDKYMYITVNKRFDHTLRISYSSTEIVEHVEQIQHPVVREALKIVGVTNGLEIVSVADIPARTGLGSSSSFTVGLLNALYAYTGTLRTAEELAQEAARIEIEILKEPIGKQDHYIAAYGGVQLIQFNSDESVFVDPVVCSPKLRGALNRNLMLFYTGVTRDARNILKEQNQKTKSEETFGFLSRMRNIAFESREALLAQNLDRFGKLLHESWMYKRQITNSISNNKIDGYYEKALAAGALGGKILGAGGGGFVLLYCDKKSQPKVREALKELREVPFSFEPQGSKIIYVG